MDPPETHSSIEGELILSFGPILLKHNPALNSAKKPASKWQKWQQYNSGEIKEIRQIQIPRNPIVCSIRKKRKEIERGSREITAAPAGDLVRRERERRSPFPPSSPPNIYK
ncbi:hypothetical protein DsansV1_C17g0144481 [Dioscorea sansibarensis]